MAMTRSSGFKVGMGIAIAALAGIQQAAAQAPTLSVDPSRLPRSAPSTRVFNRTIWKWSRSPADGSGSLTTQVPQRRRLAALIMPGISRRARIPTSTRIGSPSTCRTPDCADWLPRWPRPICASAAPGPTRTYFAESDETPATPPNGFSAVLSRERWKAVIDFARAADAEIVTSMATSAGARDAAGRWQSDQARRLFAYTRSVGGRIAAAEFMNEPTLAAMGGAPDGYDAAAYGRDFKAFVAFIRASEPDAMVLGPGSIGETAAPQSSRRPAPDSSLRGTCLQHPAPASTLFPIITTARSRNDARFRVKPRPRPRFRKRGWRARTERLRFTNRSGTSSRLTSRCG